MPLTRAARLDTSTRSSRASRKTRSPHPSVKCYELRLTRGCSNRRVTFDEDAVTTLESNEHVKAVEADGVMTTQ